MNSQPHNSTEIQNDDISGETSVRIIPGPAGVYQRAKLRKIADIREGRDVSTDTTQEYIRKFVADVGFDDDFIRGPWLSAVDYANANGWVVNGCLGDIKSYIKKGKVDLVLAIIKSCTPNALGDLTVTLKDLSGSLSGAALILRNISVFPPKSGHYLNITMKNLVKIRGNVNDDEIQHTQDEEALNLAIEEEARYARIDQVLQIAVDYANANGWVVNGCLGDIKSYIKKGKVDLVLAIIKSCTPNALGDLTVTLKDLSGSLSGAALILRNISVFSPKSGHYLNITMKNLVKVFKKDTPPGCSGI
ncbi:hypothetical protein CTI12_AA021440 [Artemisia annua]|uniref:Homologous recombination OB-fold protein OB-fold domain-containing protein n=1 Tax=Artemisia annua TaxID=35608 RepID=A0A2U1QJJ5_ARTAN|nr:hypothetical protein CTI12_AA021440 [Artemisia annua]